MAFYIELGALIAALFVLYVIYRFLKEPMLVLANSVLGFIVFLLLDLVFGLGIPVNFWSIAVVALGGFGGVIFVLILHFLGLGF
jgi:hypothetical protein